MEVKSAKVEVAEKYQSQIEKMQQQHSAQITEILLQLGRKKKKANKRLSGFEFDVLGCKWVILPFS